MLFGTLVWYEVLIRIGSAVLAGGLIGLERELSRHPAGIRTHSLVCIGAALAAMIACESAGTFGGVNGATVDITRTSLAVIQGIGFIGAGAIMHSRRGNAVTGLTTAATLWVTACIGLAIGLGYYGMALVSLATAMAVVILLRLIMKKTVKSRHLVEIDIVMINRRETMEVVEEYCGDRSVAIHSMELLGEKNEFTDDHERISRVRYLMRLPGRFSPTVLLHELQLLDGVLDAQEVLYERGKKIAAK